MKHWTLAVVFILGAITGLAQEPLPMSSGKSPKVIVEQLWKAATEGELLTKAGWARAAGLYVQPTSYPGNRVVRVVSNDWGVEHASTEGKTAEVVMEYGAEAGQIDSELRYTASAKVPSFKEALIFRLALTPTHGMMKYQADGKMIEKQTPGPLEWKITDSQGVPWTTVNTAIRYVLEMRDKTTDPLSRRMLIGP